MKNLVGLLLMLLTGLSVAAELVVPKTFVNGEVADADDFNSNNKYLTEKIGELMANARWKNALDHGAIIKNIDCTSNQSALIEAYHANAHEDHLQFKLTGSCFGAYRFVQEITENGPSEVTQIQPKNQVIQLLSDPSNRAKIIPRKIVADREYEVAGLVSSFGNGLYIADIDIEMGADDAWGVLFSRSSNGALTNVKITGAEEPTGDHVGVHIQNGAAAYVGGNDANAIIQNVSEGIKLRSSAMGNFWGTLQIAANTTGIDTFNGGTFTLSLSGDGKIVAPKAINLNQGGQGFISNNQASVSIEGSIDINASSLSIYGSTVLSSDATINVYSSTLNIWNDNSGIAVDRLNCNGPSSVGVNGIAVRNDNGNGCLDATGWKTVIDSAFPVSSGSKAPEPVISSQNRRANSIRQPNTSGGGDLSTTAEGLAW